MIVYPFLNMDALTQHRKAKLKALIGSKPYEGNQAEFGRKAGVTKARITQLLDENESFGERAAQSLCDKLELSTRYFENGFIAITENYEITQALKTSALPHPAPSLADTLTQLGQVIAASDELTRDQLKPLFTRMLDEPQRAPEIIKRIESTINSSGGSAPATNVGHTEKPGFLK